MASFWKFVLKTKIFLFCNKTRKQIVKGPHPMHKSNREKMNKLLQKKKCRYSIWWTQDDKQQNKILLISLSWHQLREKINGKNICIQILLSQKRCFRGLSKHFSDTTYSIHKSSNRKRNGYRPYNLGLFVFLSRVVNIVWIDSIAQVIWTFLMWALPRWK